MSELKHHRSWNAWIVRKYCAKKWNS